jgi:hypothetical protein
VLTLTEIQALYNESNPLPVELTSFTPTSNRDNVIINWKTATEVNNYGFEVERRKAVKPLSSGVDEINLWTKIGFVQGNGTSNSPHNYSFTDEKLDAGTYAYQLKQIDNNGAFKYSQEAEVTVVVPKVFALNQNYPNPFNPTTTISYELSKDSRACLKIYDILGRDVMMLVDEQQTAGYYQKTFNAHGLASGVYIYRLIAMDDQNNCHVFQKKMLILK